MNAGDLERLDASLLGLRRFADAPGARGGATLVHGSERVEVSTVLVVDAVARRSTGGRCSIGTVAEELCVAHSTASRLIDRAARAGMVHRAPSESDPRRTIVTLSTAGEQLRREALAFRTGRLEQLLADWAVDDVAVFVRLLDRFARSAHLCRSNGMRAPATMPSPLRARSHASDA